MRKISLADISVAHLRALIAVADAGSFTRAAVHTGLSQSAISQSIGNLESVLGAALLVRDRGGVSLTELGEQVLADARGILDRLDAIRQHGSRAAGLETGTLRIAAVPSAAARVVPPMMKRYRRRHPGVSIVLVEGTDAEVADWVRQRVADVGLLSEGATSLAGLESSIIAEDELLLVVPDRHAMAGAGRVSLRAVRGEPVLMSSGGCEPLIRAAFTKAGTTPNVTMTIREMSTLLSLVREGFGITVVPALSLPAAGLSSLKALGLRPAEPRRLALVTAAGARKPAVTAFRALAGAADAESVVAGKGSSASSSRGARRGASPSSRSC